MLGKYDEGMKRMGETVTYLASSTDAVKVLEKDGFKAKTVAHFLLDEKMQAAAAGGRVVVDETSLLGHKDAVQLLRLAEKNDLKLIFVGDPMQHGSVPRGAFMRVLKDYGCIQPFPPHRNPAAGIAGIPGGGWAAVRGQIARRLQRPRRDGLGQGIRRS